jgi:hypothetical protein
LAQRTWRTGWTGWALLQGANIGTDASQPNTRIMTSGAPAQTLLPFARSAPRDPDTLLSFSEFVQRTQHTLDDVPAVLWGTVLPSCHVHVAEACNIMTDLLVALLNTVDVSTIPRDALWGFVDTCTHLVQQGLPLGSGTRFVVVVLEWLTRLLSHCDEELLARFSACFTQLDASHIIECTFAACLAHEYDTVSTLTDAIDTLSNHTALAVDVADLVERACVAHATRDHATVDALTKVIGIVAGFTDLVRCV